MVFRGYAKPRIVLTMLFTECMASTASPFARC
jgi:hypothetical protein